MNFAKLTLATSLFVGAAAFAADTTTTTTNTGMAKTTFNAKTAKADCMKEKATDVKKCVADKKTAAMTPAAPAAPTTNKM